jgi:DNA-binding NtrC family response regulator
MSASVMKMRCKSNVLAEQQRRADELAAKLDGLRQIEQSMVNKASKEDTAMMHAGRVLLVDDDADLLRLLSLRLEAAGYLVDKAASAEAALSALAVRRADVLLTDWRLPGMDGMALFELVKKSYPSMPVIMLTAHGTVPDAVDAVSRGVFGYLVKPFDSAALLTKVEQALQLSAPAIALMSRSLACRGRELQSFDG